MDRKIPCEVYSRIVGYLRPVENWNVAKQLEFKERTLYDVGRSGLPSRDDKEPELPTGRKERNETDPRRRAALQVYMT